MVVGMTDLTKKSSGKPNQNHCRCPPPPLPPPTPLPRPVRCVEPARHIIGDAVCTRFGMIRARGGAMDKVPSQRKNKGKFPQHTQQSNGPAPPPTPLPRPVRCNKPARHIIGVAVCARLDLIRARGGAMENVPFWRENKGKFPQHTQQSDGLLLPPIPLCRLVWLDLSPHHIIGDRVYLIIHLMRLRGGAMDSRSTRRSGFGAVIGFLVGLLVGMWVIRWVFA